MDYGNTELINFRSEQAAADPPIRRLKKEFTENLPPQAVKCRLANVDKLDLVAFQGCCDGRDAVVRIGKTIVLDLNV